MIALHRHTTSVPASSALSVRQMLMAATTQLTAWIERYQQRRELLALSDHTLKDVGISRADADHEGSKHFWQD